jgi:hypothetical protein
MQLEIKIIIDFGDDAQIDENSMMQLTAARLQGHVIGPIAAIHDVETSSSMGWTSSGDDEE